MLPCMFMQQIRPPLLVIIGATASGKSVLAVNLAIRLGGEVISADSRQVYMFLNDTTGKITDEEMQGVPHHMLDIIHPGELYNAYQFSKDATECVESIYDRHNLPIVAGGSGFYINSLLFNGATASVPPDNTYRQKMESLDLHALQQILKKKNAEVYNRIDSQNPRRLVRALEIIRKLGTFPLQKQVNRYAYHMIGITHSRSHLRMRITERLNDRFDVAVEEVEDLLGRGVPVNWFEQIGLECRYISRMLTQRIPKEKTKTDLCKAIFAYAKRQETWFRRYSEAVWYHENQFNQMYCDLDDLYHNNKNSF